MNWTNKIKDEELQEVIKTLDQNGIVVFPTETVYGIACNALSIPAIEKLYEVKKRQKNKPFSIFVSNTKDIGKIAKINNIIEKKIIEKFMPGPITIILEKENSISDIVTAGKSTVGVRIPNYKIVNTILNKAKLTLAVSSANISGKENEINFEKIVETFENSVDIFIRDENINVAKASTIVQVINNEPVILREGIITKEDIKEIIKNTK